MLEGVHDAAGEELGVAVGGLAHLDDRAEVIEPVEPGLVALEAGQQAVDHVGSLADGLGEFVADEVGGVLDGELVAVLVLHEGQVLLDVVAEGQHVGLLAADGHDLLAVEVPDFVLVGLG